MEEPPKKLASQIECIRSRELIIIQLRCPRSDGFDDQIAELLASLRLLPSPLRPQVRIASRERRRRLMVGGRWGSVVRSCQCMRRPL